MKLKNILCITLLLFGCLFVMPLIGLASAQETSQSRLDWNLKMIVGAYQTVGKTNSAWNESAKRALTEYATIMSGDYSPDKTEEQTIATNCDAAIGAGCADPMARYIYVRYSMIQTDTPPDFAKALCDVAIDMGNSSYPHIVKFYAIASAIHQTSKAYGSANKQTDLVVRKFLPLLQQNLVAVLQDKATPPEEIYNACVQGLDALDFRSDDYSQTYSLIEPLLFTNWSNESITWLLKGDAYVDMAWNARGWGLAGTVSDEGWEIFEKDIPIAKIALNRAWELNPKDARIADEMMTAELGSPDSDHGIQIQGSEYGQLELWFNRAMELDPNDYQACWTKLQYVEPKWYGSVQDMLKFTQDILQHTNWGGSISLIVVEAHNDIWSYYTDKSKMVNYWKQPRVHFEIQAAYERYFQLNPNYPDIDKDYAMRAYYTEQWKEFIELASKVRPMDYDNISFGEGDYAENKKTFNQMVQYAKEMIQYDKKHNIQSAPIENPEANVSDLTILSAKFGMGTQVADVTKRFIGLLHTFPDGFTVAANSFGADPLPGKKKHLIVHYNYQGKDYTFTILAMSQMNNQSLIDNASK